MEIEQITAPAHSQLFADDILLDAISQSVEFLNLTLSRSVSNLANYFLEERGLILNPSKPHVLALHASRRQPLLLNIECNGNPLAQTTNARYLGLHLDSQLRWETQVATITRKTSQKLTPLRAIRSCLTEQQALLFYRSLILPDMLYGSNAFFSVLSAHQRHQLSVLDKRCIRCVANQPFLSHTDPIYTRLGLIPIIQTPTVNSASSCFVSTPPELVISCPSAYVARLKASLGSTIQMRMLSLPPDESLVTVGRSFLLLDYGTPCPKSSSPSPAIDHSRDF